MPPSPPQPCGRNRLQWPDRVPVDGDPVPGRMAGAAARAEDGMTPGALRALLADGRDPATPVTPDRCWGRFRADVTGLSLRLRTQGIRRDALWCKDGYAFAVGLLGMAQAGCAVVLPPHAQPGFLAECFDAWDAMISDDLDGAVPPLAEPAADPRPPAASNSSPRAPPVGSGGRFVPSTFWNERPPRWKISGADPAWASPTPRSPTSTLMVCPSRFCGRSWPEGPSRRDPTTFGKACPTRRDW